MNKSSETFFHHKIVSLPEVPSRVGALRQGDLKVAHCHGVFDVLHPGHVDHLEEARRLADVLIVSVTSDVYVNKGPGRPVYGIKQRLRMLASLGIVDLVFESNSPTALVAIDHVKPDYFVKGPDYQVLEDDMTGNILLERNQVEKNGGSLVFTKAPSMSSSQIINSQGLAHSPQAERWLHDFRQSFTQEDLADWVGRVSDLNVVVVGEMIVDEYTFCDPLGKTSKEPVLAFLVNSTERQVGGALAIAKHCRGLGANVTLVSRFGKDEAGNFAESTGTVSGIDLRVQRSDHHKTIVKTRFVDQHTGAKVFESYEMTDEPINAKEDGQFAELLEESLKNADLVLVADYGHGLLTERAISTLSTTTAIIAVNTQSNAGNRGFNSISRYPRLDIVSLNGGEISLELRAKHAQVSDLLPDLGIQTEAKWIAVTEGAKGMALWSQTDGVVEMPAFTERVRDRVGAGDALFVAVSLFLAVGAPQRIVGLFGNLAGAAMVSDLGNRHTVKAMDLLRHAQALMK